MSDTAKVGPVAAGSEFATAGSDEQTVVHDRRDWKPENRPRVTRAEELLYSEELAPIVRQVGTGYTQIREALTALAVYTDEAQRIAAATSAAPPAPIHAQDWRAAFLVLAPVHDALHEAYTRVAEIALAAARRHATTADVERMELTYVS